MTSASPPIGTRSRRDCFGSGGSARPGRPSPWWATGSSRKNKLGDKEAVVCLDAATGIPSGRTRTQCGTKTTKAAPVRGRRRPSRPDESSRWRAPASSTASMPGRAKRQWSRDIAADAGTKPPLWGFSSSPLVIGDLVVVFACGDFAAADSLKSLRAYRADSGEPAWSSAAGKISYSSPQLAAIGDAQAVLAVSDSGLFAVDPSSGDLLWNHATAGSPGVPCSVQPRVMASKEVLFDAGAGVGTVLSTSRTTADRGAKSSAWASRFLKPSFNDFVVYGDARPTGSIPACSPASTWTPASSGGRAAATGAARCCCWPTSRCSLVISEKGEAVLVAADPTAYHELCRFQAIEGKTWNHPVVAHGRLYVRNSEEFACYELGQ